MVSVVIRWMIAFSSGCWDEVGGANTKQGGFGRKVRWRRDSRGGKVEARLGGGGTVEEGKEREER
jgi:hypothetical protein